MIDRIWLVAAVALLASGASAFADDGSPDVIELTDGTRLEGHIEQQELGKFIAIRLADGSQQIINWADVKRVLPSTPAAPATSSPVDAPVAPTAPTTAAPSPATDGSTVSPTPALATTGPQASNPDASGQAVGAEAHRIPDPVLNPAEAHVRGTLGIGATIGYASLGATFKDGFDEASYAVTGKHLKVTVDRNRWALYFARLWASGDSDSAGCAGTTCESRSMNMTGFGLAYGQRYREHVGIPGVASALRIDVGIYFGTDVAFDPFGVLMTSRSAYLVPTSVTYTFSYASSRDFAVDAQVGLGYAFGEDLHEEDSNIAGVLLQLNVGVHL